MSRWIPCVVALALLASIAGAVAGARPEAEVSVAAGMPARVDAAHPPVAFGGPDGRRALDGVWVVRGDPGNAGAARGWSRGDFGSGARVHVPYSPNAGALTLRSYAGSVAWYRTDVAVRGGRYALRFEAVNHRATVWVDGRLAARHVGDDLPFDVMVSLTPGRHRVVVRADWRDPEAMKAQGWHRSWFNYGGITREVTIRPVGAVALEAPAVVTRLTRGGGAVVDVSVRVRGGGRPRVTGTLGGHALRFDGSGHTTLRLAHPALWSPAHPRLQTLRLTAAGAGWTARVGLRELRWDGGRLRVNGRPLTLHGASLQEDAAGRGSALRPADLDAIVARLRAIGANATLAQHPLSPALLERLDAAGILVWQEIGPMDGPGNWTSTTPALRRRALRRDVITVEQERLHPSVLTWNLGNEVAHQGHPGGQARYVSSAARMLHALDPGRPVALDVWGRGLPADTRGLLYRDVDVFGVTMYEGWYDRPGEPPAAAVANLRRRLAVAHAVFSGHVLVVTEFGAEANRRNASAAPGGEGYQARLIGDLVRVMRADRRLDGWLVWALSDFALTPTFGGGSVRQALPSLRLVPGINQKGLFAYDGRPKPSVAVVRRLSR
ncbi:MAG TPA: glycoside hydrolase family 2 TIM barrel-domain containing protein [Baekduia sp.]|nr:glycoside hydrolase family 2 TIM barrel-domain containing protein [Baekduia sp.]